MCLRVCLWVCSCLCPTIGFSCTSAEIYDRSFSYNRVGFLFWNLSRAADRGSEGEAGSSTWNRWLWLRTRWAEKRKKWPSKSLETNVFIYCGFTRTASAFHINTLAVANTGVYWSDLQRSGGQSEETKLSEWQSAVDHWKIAEGFHYRVLRWRECKSRTLKTQ